MRTRTCHTCSARILVALDDRALDVTLDPAPLSPRGEALAILSGRKTFTVERPRRGAREVWKRRAYHVGSETYSATVHANHLCHDPIPARWAAVTETRRTVNPDQEPIW